MSPFSRFLKPLTFIKNIPIAYVPHLASIVTLVCFATVTIIGAIVHVASYSSSPQPSSSVSSYRPRSIIETMKQKEEKEKRTPTVFLLGDSMLDNTLYVAPDENIVSIFKTKTRHNVHLFAQDGAVISDVYSQLHKIHPDRNNNNTYICVSAGGNNILELVSLHLQRKAFNIENEDEDTGEGENVNKIFEQYKKLINAIRLKLPDANLLLLNLYYPTAEPELKPLITHWNEKMDATFENVNKRIRVVRVDQALTRPDDFTHRIEPSYEGGCKMVDLIKGVIQ